MKRTTEVFNPYNTTFQLSLILSDLRENLKENPSERRMSCFFPDFLIHGRFVSKCIPVLTFYVEIIIKN